jgi:hypothetical protein
MLMWSFVELQLQMAHNQQNYQSIILNLRANLYNKSIKYKNIIILMEYISFLLINYSIDPLNLLFIHTLNQWNTK